MAPPISHLNASGEADRTAEVGERIGIFAFRYLIKRLSQSERSFQRKWGTGEELTAVVIAIAAARTH